MNSKVEDTVDKIMRIFDSGGLVPLDLHQYSVIDAHVRSILGSARPSKRAHHREALQPMGAVPSGTARGRCAPGLGE